MRCKLCGCKTALTMTVYGCIELYCYWNCELCSSHTLSDTATIVRKHIHTDMYQLLVKLEDMSETEVYTMLDDILKEDKQ